MSRFLLKFTASSLALALCLAPAWVGASAQVSPPPAPGQSYVVIDLTPTGSATSSAAGASGARQVGSAGFAAAAGQPAVSHAMLWNGSAAGANRPRPRDGRRGRRRPTGRKLERPRGLVAGDGGEPD